MERKIILFVLSVILTLTSCEKYRITGSGSVVTESRTVANFTSVSTAGSTNVTVTHGSGFNVSVRGYQNLLPYFETKLVNGQLQVGYRSNTNVKNDNVKVFVTMPFIDGAEISGSAGMNIMGNFPATDYFNTIISGSGVMKIGNVPVNRYHATISGSGEIYAFDVNAIQAAFDISGSARAEISVDSILQATISGSGIIYYKGSPVVNAEISGSGKVIKQ